MVLGPSIFGSCVLLWSCLVAGVVGRVLVLRRVCSLLLVFRATAAHALIIGFLHLLGFLLRVCYSF